MSLSEPKAAKLRDLLVYPLDQNRSLVVACDAAGGIGPLEGDSVKISGEIIGYFTAAVALMELIAAGARPIMLADTLSVNPESGKEIVQGVMRAAGHFPGLAVTGSMEKNVQVSQTGVGVTAIGIAANAVLNRLPLPGDVLVAVGTPAVGESVLIQAQAIMDLETMLKLRKISGVSIITPCGSGGAAGELRHYPGLRLRPSNFPLNCSAGPSTCALAACRPDAVELIRALPKPVTILGFLEGE